MDPLLLAVALLGGAALAALWVLHLRADLRRRAGDDVEWDGAGEAPRIWTSAARCPECRAGGAVLSEDEDGLWHTCLACGHRHRRDVRG